jgi:hypothetical protein
VAPYLIFAAFVAGTVALEFVADARCHQCINDWAIAGRVNVLSIQRRWLLLGPWQWRASGWSRVFALSIGDDHGPAREAFAKVGGGFGGLAADDIQVR